VLAQSGYANILPKTSRIAFHHFSQSRVNASDARRYQRWQLQEGSFISSSGFKQRFTSALFGGASAGTSGSDTIL